MKWARIERTKCPACGWAAFNVLWRTFYVDDIPSIHNECERTIAFQCVGCGRMFSLEEIERVKWLAHDPGSAVLPRK